MTDTTTTENDKSVTIKMEIEIPAKTMAEITTIVTAITTEAKKHGKVDGHVAFGRTKLPL